MNGGGNADGSERRWVSRRVRKYVEAGKQAGSGRAGDSYVGIQSAVRLPLSGQNGLVRSFSVGVDLWFDDGIYVVIRAFSFVRISQCICLFGQ